MKTLSMWKWTVKTQLLLSLLTTNVFLSEIGKWLLTHLHCFNCYVFWRSQIHSWEFFTPILMSLFIEDEMRKNMSSEIKENTVVVVVHEHLLHKAVWPRSVSFGTLAVRDIQYLRTHCRSNLAVFDDHPSIAANKSTKNLERVCRAKTACPDVIFDESTISIMV